MLKKLLSVILPRDQASQHAERYRNVIRRSAQMGGALFGPVPDGARREFFCLDEHTWVWHEEWTDGNNLRHARTTRYDVRPHGIFKAQDGEPYQMLSLDEADRLEAAVYAYQRGVHEMFDPVLATA